MRGKGHCTSFTNWRVGITPAYAGKRRRCFAFRWLPWDHPRVCGEKLRKTAVSVRELGSPPRMRGKVEIHCHVVFDVGITPAYAGKSFCPQRLIFRPTDHPRVCGEKLMRRRANGEETGSPPRMRGKAYLYVCPDRQRGITPAYAGERFLLAADGLLTRDHPRVCGEKGLS